MPLEEILGYWRVLKKRLWLIALLVGVTVATIFFQQYTAEAIYRASIRFQISSPPRTEVSVSQALRVPEIREEIPYIRQNFRNVLTSGAVARQVIETLGLQNRSAEEIIAGIEIEDIQGSDFSRLIVSANDPQLAADIANTLIQEGMRQYGQLRAVSATTSREFIEAELEANRQELQQAQEKLIAFQIENRIGSLGAMIGEQQVLLRNLRLARDEAWAAGLTDRVGNYDKVIRQREAELQDLVRLSASYDALQAEVDEARKTYSFLLEKQTQAKLAENEARAVGFIQVIDMAHPPAKPVSPYNFEIIGLGGIISLVLGVVLAFIWEFLVAASRHAKIKETEETVMRGTAEA